MQINEEFIDDISTEDIQQKHSISDEPIYYDHRIFINNDGYLGRRAFMIEHRQTMLCSARSADMALRSLPFITQYKIKVSIGIENQKEPTRIFPDLGDKYELWHVPTYTTPDMNFKIDVEFNADHITYKRAVRMIGMLFTPSGVNAAFRPINLGIRIRRGIKDTNVEEIYKSNYDDYLKKAYDVFRYGHVFKNFIQELAPDDTFCEFCTQIKELRDFQEETLLTFCGNLMNSAKGPEKHKLRFKFNNDDETVDAFLLMTTYVFDPGQFNGCYWLSGKQFTKPQRNFYLEKDDITNILRKFYKREPHIANIYKAKTFHSWQAYYIFFNSPLMIDGLEYGVFLMLDGAFEPTENIRIAKDKLWKEISASK